MSDCQLFPTIICAKTTHELTSNMSLIIINCNQIQLFQMEEENSTAAKLKQLSDKMASLTFTHQKEEHKRLEAIHDHVRKLEDSFNKQRPLEETKLQVLKDQMHRSSEAIKTELSRISSKSQGLQEKVLTHRSLVANLLELQQNKESQEKDNRAEDNNNELMSLCSLIQKQESNMYDSFETTYCSLTSRTASLKEQLHREQTSREDNIIRISDSMEGEITRFKEMMEVEQGQRRESEGKIAMMVGEIRGKLKEELEKQRKRRMDCNNLMLGLLETACQKMERRLK